MRSTKIQIKAIWEIFALHFMKEDSIWLLGSKNTIKTHYIVFCWIVTFLVVAFYDGNK